MLKVGDLVAVKLYNIYNSVDDSVGRFIGKIIRISDHLVKPLYKIKYDNSSKSFKQSPWHYGWRYEEDLLHIVVICS
jgi:hypothetical protein